jgi:hypothetical protein
MISSSWAVVRTRRRISSSCMGVHTSCATPPAVCAARGHFSSDRQSLAATEHISLLFRALAHVARV